MMRLLILSVDIV